MEDERKRKERKGEEKGKRRERRKRETGKNWKEMNARDEEKKKGNS